MTLVCAALVAMVAVGPAAATVAKGKVGGPPTRQLNPPDEGERTTPELVIGAGKTYDGWLQIDAYGWKPHEEAGVAPPPGPSICTWIEFETESFPSYGNCLAPEEVHLPIMILSDVSGLGPERDTQIGGPVSAEASRVVLFVTRPGRKGREKVNAVVGHVRGKLQGELGLTAPYAYFFAKFPGIVQAKYVEAVAYDAQGHKLGSSRGPHSIPQFV